MVPNQISGVIEIVEFCDFQRLLLNRLRAAYFG